MSYPEQLLCPKCSRVTGTTTFRPLAYPLFALTDPSDPLSVQLQCFYHKWVPSDTLPCSPEAVKSCFKFLLTLDGGKWQNYYRDILSLHNSTASRETTNLAFNLVKFVWNTVDPSVHQDIPWQTLSPQKCQYKVWEGVHYVTACFNSLGNKFSGLPNFQTQLDICKGSGDPYQFNTLEAVDLQGQPEKLVNQDHSALSLEDFVGSSNLTALEAEGQDLLQNSTDFESLGMGPDEFQSMVVGDDQPDQDQGPGGSDTGPGHQVPGNPRGQGNVPPTVPSGTRPSLAQWRALLDSNAAFKSQYLEAVAEAQRSGRPAQMDWVKFFPPVRPTARPQLLSTPPTGQQGRRLLGSNQKGPRTDYDWYTEILAEPIPENRPKPRAENRQNRPNPAGLPFPPRTETPYRIDAPKYRPQSSRPGTDGGYLPALHQIGYSGGSPQPDSVGTKLGKGATWAIQELCAGRSNWMCKTLSGRGISSSQLSSVVDTASAYVDTPESVNKVMGFIRNNPVAKDFAAELKKADFSVKGDQLNALGSIAAIDAQQRAARQQQTMARVVGELAENEVWTKSTSLTGLGIVGIGLLLKGWSWFRSGASKAKKKLLADVSLEVVDQAQMRAEEVARESIPMRALPGGAQRADSSHSLVEIEPQRHRGRVAKLSRGPRMARC